jgi:hypothetical protein
MATIPVTPQSSGPELVGTTATPAKPVAKPKYRIVVLPPHVDEANAVLAKAALDGYVSIQSVYVVAAPSSASTAFAVLGQS